MQDYDEALRLEPGNASAFKNRGYARYKAGDMVEALTDFNHAIQLRPDYANAFYNRARVWRATAHAPAAIADLL